MSKRPKATEPKEKNVGSLFTPWELSEFPTSLLEGIRRAEKRDFIRTELHKLQKFKNGKLAPRSKFLRMNGNIGYEQLKLLNLSDAPEGVPYL